MSLGLICIASMQGAWKLPITSLFKSLRDMKSLDFHFSLFKNVLIKTTCDHVTFFISSFTTDAFEGNYFTCSFHTNSGIQSDTLVYWIVLDFLMLWEHKISIFTFEYFWIIKQEISGSKVGLIWIYKEHFSSSFIRTALQWNIWW